MPATRGPLQPAVYWRRRLGVLSVALVVVLGLGKMLDLGSDGPSGEGTATQAGGTTLTSPTATVSAPTGDGKGKGAGKGKGKHPGGRGGQGQSTPPATPPATPATTPPPTLPDPTGPCPDDDIYITPTIASPIGGSDVTITLNLQTKSTVACTWQLSPDTMRMDIVSGADQIWLSRQCPDAIPTQDVVVRLASVTQVPVVWSSRRSDDGCTDRTAWALPGSYHVRAGALGGEPTDVQFELLAPTAPTVTVTAQPHGSGKSSG